MIRRREFITLLGGAAAWPVVARAQQGSLPVIGVLDQRSPEALADRMRGFRRGLTEAGFLEGQTVTIDYRWGDNKIDRLPEMATELVRRQVAVIAAMGGIPSALAAKAATPAIPIVFIVSEDPVKLGLVASLARPGSNMTGINFVGAELTGKRLELLRELVPAAKRVAVLVNHTNVANADTTLRDVEVAARTMGLEIQAWKASSSSEINAAFAAVRHDERPDALFVGVDAYLNSRRAQLINLTARYGLPASYGVRDFPEIGGLISYGASIIEASHQVGSYVARILKGAKPADLPVVQPTKFELVINLQTAAMLGISVPPTLLAGADEVIE
jgi:putative tryptophan/tyrosine transport system substrate-binding protein